MKNTLIAILVIVILVLGYLFIKEKTKPVDYSNAWPETEPAQPHTGTTTNDNPNGPDYTPPQNSVMTTYSAVGFSFKYDSSATVGITTNAGQTLYWVQKEGEVSELIKLVNTSELDPSESCGDIETLTTTINGKDFKYCNSRAEPSTTYFYTEGNKTLVIVTQGTRRGYNYSYIDPGSVEIN